MSGFMRVRSTPQQREDFAACSVSERQWLERNSKMTMAGCNEELGFPIAQVDEVRLRTCIMLIRQYTDFVPLGQVWTVFQQVTIEQNLTQKFTAHDYCTANRRY